MIVIKINKTFKNPQHVAEFVSIPGERKSINLSRQKQQKMRDLKKPPDF